MNMNELSLIHISEPTRQAEISYAVFCFSSSSSASSSHATFASYEVH